MTVTSVPDANDCSSKSVSCPLRASIALLMMGGGKPRTRILRAFCGLAADETTQASASGRRGIVGEAAALRAR